jgi:hypothetical protein
MPKKDKNGKKEKKEKKPLPPPPERKTEEERNLEIAGIIQKLTDENISGRQFQSIGVLFEKCKEFKQTGESAKGCIQFPELCRKIVYDFKPFKGQESIVLLREQ